MFVWYRDSMQCYAYLADVRDVRDIRNSRWFTRGWTLQELIAPSSVLFFDRDWKEIGSKTSLAEEICNITGIPRAVLRGSYEMEYSIAQIMSWASSRETTREEDIAYSLLGLFGVHMPMIYGEGKKAFRRLQLEIMKESNDQSIFAWTGTGDQRGPLAVSPAEFCNCGRVRRIHFRDSSGTEYAMTNKGLRINLLIGEKQNLLDTQQGRRIYFAILNCHNEHGFHINIYLRKVHSEEFVRIRCSEIFQSSSFYQHKEKVKKQELYLLDPSSPNFALTGSIRPHQDMYVIILSWESLLEHDFALLPNNREFEIIRYDTYPGKSICSWVDKGWKEEVEFTFTKTDRTVVFKVVLGIKNRQMWCTIEPHKGLLERWYDSEDLEGLIMEKGEPLGSDHRREARRIALDRLTLPVSNDLSASTAIRPGLVDGEKGILANVSVSRMESMELETH